MISNFTIIIKGAGDIASGIARRLYSADIRKILMTELEQPLTVRRTVSFSESIYDGKAEVEGVKSILIDNTGEATLAWDKQMIAVIADPDGQRTAGLKPDVLIDATMMKKEKKIIRGQIPLVIGVGPGFVAPVDVHAVIESNRGHYLGRVIRSGSAEPFTGVPGANMGFTVERVLRSPKKGVVRHAKHIGDIITKGTVVLYVDEVPVLAHINGVLRGLIREIPVEENEKVGDIDPRGRIDFCYSISDKARAIGGGVLEAVMQAYSAIDPTIV